MMDRLRIMISSTIQDLSQERDIVSRAINEFCFERFRSESMGSISRSPQEVCDEMARECDLYILIIGERYGWIIPQTGISVTEREFDIAREADRHKILVYVKNIPHGQREAKAEALLNKVTDFSQGYFRSAPFSSILELKKRVKNDIAIWITDKIREGNISLSNVFSLPNTKDVLLQAGFTFGILAIFIALLGIAKKISPSNFFIPSAIDLLEKLPTVVPAVLSSAEHTMLISILSYFFAIFASSLMICICLILNKGRNGILLFLSSLFFVITLFEFFFSQLIFEFGYISSLVASTSPAIFIILLSALNEIKKIDIDWKIRTANETISLLLKNVFLSSSFSSSFLVIFIYTIAQELFFSRKGLGHLIMFYYEYLELAKAYLVFIVIACIALISYTAIRLFQAYWGWTQIIEPIISHTRQRPKL